ncbi:MAG: hypothetical protein WD377_03345 [Nitriliruptoraceae bacterium]
MSLLAGVGDWFERSFLVPSSQVAADEMFDIAAELEQHSIFELTDEMVRIVPNRIPTGYP